MKKVITDQKIKVDISNFNEDTLKALFVYSKEFYKKNKYHRHSYGYLDIMIYNVIRNKPLFNGFDRLKADTFYILEYQSQRLNNSSAKIIENLGNYSDFIKGINKLSIEEECLKTIIQKISNTYLNAEYKEV